MTITSVFQSNGHIPTKYTCDGENISPPLIISKVPENVESLVLLVEDPDAPAGTFTHWVVYDIPPAIERVEEGKAPTESIEGTNDARKIGYTGPCPPSGTHRYIFTLFGLDTSSLNLPPGAYRGDVGAAMNGHVIDSAELIGLYTKIG